MRKHHGQLGIHTEKLKGENKMKGPKAPARFGRQEGRMPSGKGRRTPYTAKAATRSGQTNRHASHSAFSGTTEFTPTGLWISPNKVPSPEETRQAAGAQFLSSGQ
jgi:hypothetical protein